MTRYLINRILTSIPTLIAISMVVFLILALAPGNPMGEFANNPSITPEVRENIKRSLGLDQPIPIRYLKWIWAFLQGDLGYSFTSRSPVLDLIFQRLPTTLWIMGAAYSLAVLIAFPLGIISALKRYSFWDQIITTVSFIGFSLPTFFTGLLFIIIFSVQLKWLPFIYNSTLEVTNLQTFWQQIQQSIMPVCVLGFYQAAILMRFIRSSFLEQLNQNYVRTAYAKGLPKLNVINGHILRNALIPVVTLIALQIPGLFAGSLVTEQVFRIPGIGALLIDSIFRSDTPVIMGITMVYAILVVIFNLFADILYGFLDPRVQY
ncbi:MULTISPECIES: ABC transporter permease [Planktothrix]|jgi:peptide/nickel transport system permease protein|uniref:Oligopeptide transport system permease protein AppB n=2 Tax=Planktothrix TaxID=54304 RepID=A0A6J7ZER0_PLARU|nr:MULTISPECIES: ABC transporter permease [Planktothrix]GDZ95276.1 putative ABC transporter permease protein [Planktothrix agardhii CCAP 1459/11A]CAC5342026.1 Oligopeptide transport system permease protein AppB [Planktothrix rubescens NIVA-CYA 18]CAD5926658.1 Oligopeptide transport system permease protein AppB [Planktothrix rubescens NIVA-CYA 18]CAD5964862.1 Oligopeptide transport system permease protein AppB [Planktothrix agardhii]